MSKNKQKGDYKNEQGYEIYRSLRAGTNSTWTYKNPNGEKSAYGFDSAYQVEQHIRRNENINNDNPSDNY